MTSTSLRYAVVDVFAKTPFTGNQLAVVFDADDLSTYQLQRIAAEFNLAETTFPVDRTEADVAAGADYRMRIFTSSMELPFAGHPTVGTAWLLARRGLIGTGRRLQACGAGLIELTIPDDAASPVELGAAPRDVSPPLGAHAVRACAESVGLSAEDVVGEVVAAGCGINWVCLQVQESALARVRPRSAGMDEVALPAPLQDPLIGVDVFAITGTAGDGSLSIRSRVFVPGVVVAEDPATGSAAVGLGVALAATGRAAADGTTRYSIVQGVEIGRPSHLFGRVEASGGRATKCWVAGQVHLVAEGSIAVPPVDPM
jgi:trans-2,3-dihydro-3-hydroxyanthranilate isomerase